MINYYENGDGKMLDNLSFKFALKATWISKHFDSTIKGKWENLFDCHLQTLDRQNIFLYNLSRNTDLKILKAKDTFVREIVEIWTNLHFNQSLETFESLMEQDYVTRL